MKQIHGAEDIEATLRTMADEIVAHSDSSPMAFVGIHSAGVPLARRLYELVKPQRSDLEFGQVDVLLYRDDAGLPLRGSGSFGTEIDFEVDDRRIILVDDVLYTGRTVRAAIDQLVDFGRPAKVELAVLVDRGHRQFPIQADYVGYRVETQAGDHVRVTLKELGAEDSIRLTPAAARSEN